MNENFEKKFTISFDVLFRYQFVVKIVEEISKKPEGFKIRLKKYKENEALRVGVVILHTGLISSTFVRKFFTHKIRRLFWLMVYIFWRILT